MHRATRVDVEHRVRDRPSRGAGCRRGGRSKCAARPSGSPIRPRNTDDGNSSANSSVKLHSPRSMNASMNSLTRRGDVGLLLVHALGREQRVEQLAVLRVLGRIDVEGDQRTHVAERHVDARREQLVVAQHEVVELAAEHHDDAVHGRRHPALLDHVAVHRLRFGQVQQRVHLHLRVALDRGDVRSVGLLIGHVGPPEPRRDGDDTDPTARPQYGAASWTARSAERFGIRFVHETRHELTRDAVAASDVGQGLTLGVQDLEEETLGIVPAALQRRRARRRGSPANGCGSITRSRSPSGRPLSTRSRATAADRACRRAR